MSTKQKLIAAATAAKLDVYTFSVNEHADIDTLVLTNEFGITRLWNPYRFLIDATRLACQLRIGVEHHATAVVACHYGHSEYLYKSVALDEVAINELTQREAAYCKAVTDCAAAMGGYKDANS